jgi:hypothetical protein
VSTVRRSAVADIPTAHKSVILVVSTLLGPAWDAMAMLFLRAAHHYDHRVPALGFWTVFFLAAAYGVIASSAGYSNALAKERRR